MRPWSTARRGGRWIAIVAIGAALTTLVGIGVATSGRYLWGLIHPPAPPISRQLDAIMTTASRQGQELIYDLPVDLRGTGSTARVMIFQPTYPSPSNPFQPSDEIRIYDLRGGWLRADLSFTPRGPPRGKYQPWPYLVSVLGVRNLTDAGAKGLIVSFGQEYVDDVIAHPVLIYWDPGSQTYRLLPLSSPSTLRRLNLVSAPAGLPGRQDLYTHPALITDASGHHKSFLSYGAEEIDILPSQGPLGISGIDLAAVYVVSQAAQVDVREVQVAYWTVELSDWPPTVSTCLAYPPHRPIILRASGPLAWRRLVRTAEMRLPAGC